MKRFYNTDISDKKQQKIVVCLLSVDEIEQVIDIQEKCELSHWTRNGYTDELGKEHSLIFVAKLDSKIVGFLASQLLIGEGTETVSGNQKSEYTEAAIVNFGVLPEHRRKGVGKLLFDALLQRVGSPALTAVWLEVRASNTNAISFYEKNRFVEIQRRKNFYSNPSDDAIVMKYTVQKQ